MYTPQNYKAAATLTGSVGGRRSTAHLAGNATYNTSGRRLKIHSESDLADAAFEVVHETKYHLNVVKLAAKFDDELKRLLDELRKQAHREWNLAHLCSRLDYNAYWSTPAHAQFGAAASLAAAAQGAAGVAEESHQEAPKKPTDRCPQRSKLRDQTAGSGCT